MSRLFSRKDVFKSKFPRFNEGLDEICKFSKMIAEAIEEGEFDSDETLNAVVPSSARMSSDKIDQNKAKAIQHLRSIRASFLNGNEFLASVMMSLELKPVWDDGLKTACTDGKSIFFNMGFLEGLTFDEKIFVLAHETWHNVFQHFLRQGIRSSNLLWNIAGDLEINQRLIKQGLKMPDGCLLPDVVTDMYNINPPLPKDESAEMYYELISKFAKDQANQLNSVQGGSGQPANPWDQPDAQASGGQGQQNQQGGQQGQPGQSGSQSGQQGQQGQGQQGQQGGQQGQQGQPGQSGSQSGQQGRGGQQSGGQGQQKGAGTAADQSIDKIAKEIADRMPNNSPNPKDELNKGSNKQGTDPDFKPASDAEIGQNQKNITGAAKTKANKMKSEGRGSGIGGFDMDIEEFEKSGIDWKAVLRKFITVCKMPLMNNWSRMKRRMTWSYFQNGAIVPDKKGFSMKTYIGVDSSGSCVSELPRFLGAVKEITESIDVYDIEVFTCDTKVNQVFRYNNSHRLDVEELSAIKGGGGTNVEPLFEAAKEERRHGRVKADCIIIFTDGEHEIVTPEMIKGIQHVLVVLTPDGTDAMFDKVKGKVKTLKMPKFD